MRDCPTTENPIATHIVDACFQVYGRMGPGLLESVYEATLGYELGQRGVPVVYDEVRLDLGFRIDLLVEGEAPILRDQTRRVAHGRIE